MFGRSLHVNNSASECAGASSVGCVIYGTLRNRVKCVCYILLTQLEVRAKETSQYARVYIYEVETDGGDGSTIQLAPDLRAWGGISKNLFFFLDFK